MDGTGFSIGRWPGFGIFPKPEVVVVDDNRDDLELLKRAFKAAGLTTPAEFLSSGEEAIQMLLRCSEAWSYPLLVLLDLKMPRISGLEVLEWIRSRTDLQDVCVVMLSHSGHEADIGRAREIGANSYWIKPATFHDWILIVKKLKNVVHQLGKDRVVHRV